MAGAHVPLEVRLARWPVVLQVAGMSVAGLYVPPGFAPRYGR